MRRRLFTAYPQLRHLNSYSKQVALLPFRQYPQWLPTCAYRNEDDTYLMVAVPAPIHPRERDLLISTEGERLTIHFDWYHAHFNRWAGKTLKAAFADAMEFLTALFREELVVGITMKDGHL